MVEQQIRTEISNGRYKVCAEPPLLVSSLGAIPKPGGGKIRLIHDCSRPEGGALNDFATGEKFAYQTLKDAASLIQPNDFVGKIDLSNAYRSVKIHPDDYALTGLQWTFSGDEKSTYFQDQRLPFGAKKGPELFNRLTQAVRRIMEAQGGHKLVAYLDDFLCVGRTKEECMDTMKALMALLRRLGFSINYDKVEGPKQVLVFLGVEINTVSYTFSLTKSRVEELKGAVAQTLNLKQVTKRALQSIVGKLNWAAMVLYGGRPHLRRLIDRINCLRSPGHKTRVTSCMKSDLQWWIMNVELFNGTAPIAENRPSTSVCIDACDSGAGGYHNGDWYHMKWSDWPEVEPYHINYKEVLALVPAVCLWGPRWRGKQVVVYSDNQAAVSIFNRGTAKDSRIMDALRRVFWASVRDDFRIRAVYYPGYRNVLADAASRLSNPGGWKRLSNALMSTYIYQNGIHG